MVRNCMAVFRCPSRTPQLMCQKHLLYIHLEKREQQEIVKCEIRREHNADNVFEKGKRFDILCAKRGRNTIETERSDEFEWII